MTLRLSGGFWTPHGPELARTKPQGDRCLNEAAGQAEDRRLKARCEQRLTLKRGQDRSKRRAKHME